MIGNDDAGGLVKRGALESIASKPAPTGFALIAVLPYDVEFAETGISPFLFLYFPGFREEPFFCLKLFT